jgi:cell division protein FtsQ
MFKKILIITGYILLTTSLGAYFVFSSILTARQEERLSCRRIKVVIKDSATIRFVSVPEIKEIVTGSNIIAGSTLLGEINLHNLEKKLNNNTAVRLSQASITRDGLLEVEILQRKPILRIQTPEGGFYMDETLYLFPLIKSFSPYVPVVSGNIPLKIPAGYRGYAQKGDVWIHQMRDFALYLEKNEFWNNMTEQIYVDEKGLIRIVPRVGEHEIIFGRPENIEYKFRKLECFYKEVIPVTGWKAFKSIDLQYNEQIVCKKNENKIINKT